MKTQSVDTHPDTERMLIHLIRNAPVSKRFRLIQSLTQGALWSNIQARRERYSDASEQETAIQVISSWYGPALAARVEMAFVQRKQWHLQPIHLLTVMSPTFHLFEEHNVFCYLGGSIASSLHGMQQMAQDIDLVVDLHDQDLASLLPLLKQSYVFNEDALREAVSQRAACPCIHLDTLMKVDLVVAKQTTFDTALRQSIAPYLLDEQYPPFQVASAMEMILVKLRRYSQDLSSRTDGMRDDAEWNDIIGILKVQRSDLKRDVLENWAEVLKITETLKQALTDAGAEQEEAA
jgi:hypothetical protein